MGHVTVSASIFNPSDPSKRVTEEALVDTGTTLSILPSRLLRQLGLEVTGHRRVRTADGEQESPRSRASIEIEGRREITPVLISEKIDRVLIGVVTLELLELTVDPISGQLKEMELLFYLHRTL